MKSLSSFTIAREKIKPRDTSAGGGDFTEIRDVRHEHTPRVDFGVPPVVVLTVDVSCYLFLESFLYTVYTVEKQAKENNNTTQTYIEHRSHDWIEFFRSKYKI